MVGCICDVPNRYLCVDAKESTVAQYSRSAPPKDYGVVGESSGLPALLDGVDPIKEFCMLILRPCCATVLWWIGAIAVPLGVQSITLSKETQGACVNQSHPARLFLGFRKNQKKQSQK